MVDSRRRVSTGFHLLVCISPRVISSIQPTGIALDFLADATNAVLLGPNSIGKSTIARNIAHQALIHGYTVLFTSAGKLLGELSALDSDSALRRRLNHYASPALLAIDEVGYLS